MERYEYIENLRRLQRQAQNLELAAASMHSTVRRMLDMDSFDSEPYEKELRDFLRREKIGG